MTVFVVLDYEGLPLDGSWPTPAEAIDKGLLSKYLLSGYEVAALHDDGRVEPLPPVVYLTSINELEAEGWS